MAQVKLILLEDVDNLGLAGEEITVAPGFARNYLLPRNLAAKITSGTRKVLAARKEQIEAQRKQELADAEALAAKIAGIDLSIPMQASEDDRLFGSVTARTIAEKFAEQGIEIDYQRIHGDAIKELGMFEVEIKLHQQVSAKAKVWVVRA